VRRTARRRLRGAARRCFRLVKRCAARPSAAAPLTRVPRAAQPEELAHADMCYEEGSAIMKSAGARAARGSPAAAFAYAPKRGAAAPARLLGRARAARARRLSAACAPRGADANVDYDKVIELLCTALQIKCAAAARPQLARGRARSPRARAHLGAPHALRAQQPRCACARGQRRDLGAAS
jgi:hypothetical protein